MVVWQILALAVVAVVLPVAGPWLGFVLTVAIGKGLAALGVAILLRAGLISLGHALFVAMGAYATAFLLRGTGMNELFLLLLSATAITMATGLVIGAFMSRYRAIFFAMLNLAISMVFFTLLSKLYDLTGGTDGMRVATPTVIGITLDRANFDLILHLSTVALMVAAGLLIERYLKSPLGEALVAIHANEVRLEYLGVSARAVILAAYTVSAALAGLGGAIMAVATGHVVPELSYWTFSGQLVLIAVLGGITGAPGAFIGAFFFELVRTFAADFAPNAWNGIVGAALFIVIFFLPQGLYGLLQRAGKRKARP